jgi:hypothetical protein
VRRPKPLTRRQAEALAVAHGRKLAEVAAAVGETRLTSYFRGEPPLEVLEGQIVDPAQEMYNPILELIDDTVRAFLASIRPVRSDVSLLWHAFVSMAAEPLMAEYILWPLYAGGSPVEEPFRPFMELWKHGAKTVPGECRVRVYAPALAGR